MVKEDNGILNRQSLLTLRVYFHGYQKHLIFDRREGKISLLREGLEGVRTPYPLKMTCGFLIQPLFCKICEYVWYVLSAVHIMLLPSQKPSSYSLLKFV